MIFHWVLNSLLVFLVLTFAVELCLFVFKINNSRLRYFCRSLPILKLPFDMIVFALFDESFLINFNPFSCEMYLQDFLLNLFPNSMKAELAPNQHLIIPAYLANLLPPLVLKLFIIVIISIAIILLTTRFIKFFSNLNHFQTLLKTGIPCPRYIQNEKLNSQIKKLNVKIFISEKVHVPIAVNLHYIFFPSELIYKFSQEEFEAVLSHELEHLRWKDPILKLLNALICALYWWIPTSWWIKRLESDQEQASDFSVQRYNIDTHDLATALVKTIANGKYDNYEIAAICPFESAKGTHFQRFEKLIDSKKVPLWSTNNILGLTFCLLFFISFWMC